jgi:iron complex outermembrane receptor protein
MDMVKVSGRALLAVAVGQLSVASYAQNERSVALEEVVVVAQKRSQSLQDVPLAVNALGTDALEQSGVRTLSDISQLVPGLNISDTQSEAISVSMRGVNSNDFGFAVEQSIPIYLDGAYLGLGTSLIGDLTDISQVEVLKGPQGTLFGRNAAGGAVSISTAPVSDELGGDVRVGYGNYDLMTASTVINVPLIDDTLGIRVNAGLRQRDGWQKNISTGADDGYEQDRWFARAKLAWTPTDTFDLVWTSDYKDEDDNSGYYYLLESDFPSEIFDPVVFETDGKKAANDNLGIGTGVPESAPLDYRIDRKIQGHTAHLTWDMSEQLTLTSISAYRTLEYAVDEDNDGTEYLLLDVRDFGETDEFSQEFRLNGSTDSLDWFVGVSYYQQKLDAYVEDSFGSYIVGAPVTEFNVGSSEVKSYGLFSDVIWSATDRLNLTVGARISRDEKSQDIKTPNQNTLGAGFNFVFPSAEQLTDAQGNPDPSLASQDDEWQDVSVRGVIDYRFNDESMVFLSLSQGYKAGGFNSFPVVDFGDFFPLATPGQMEPYDEEKVNNIELGLKSEWLDGRLRLNGSIFYYDWEDLQQQISIDKALFTVNAGTAIGKGADLEMTYRLSESLMVNANLGWLDATYDEDVPGTDIREGQELTYAPKFSANLGLDHYLNLPGNWELRSHLGYTFNDSQYLSVNYRDDSYSLLSARFGLNSPDQRWELALWGRNLTDEAYLEKISDFSDIGYVSARRNEPRTYGAEIIYRLN